VASKSITNAGLSVIDFEGYPSSVAITTQYAAQGPTFDGATILVQNVSLNPPFPPHSGTDVVFDVTGAINVTFRAPVSSAGGYVTGNQVITLRCYNKAGTQVGTDALPAANFLGANTGVAPNYFLGVQAPGIVSCLLQDHGNTFTLDDFTFDPTSSGRLPKAFNRHTAVVLGTREICSGDDIPPGYVVVDAEVTIDCSFGLSTSHPPIASVVEGYADKYIGYQMGICADQPVPAGWQVINPNPPSSLQHHCKLDGVTSFPVPGNTLIIKRVS
jgi:hypothetical protein